MDAVKNLRNKQVKIRKGIFFTGPLGDSLNDERGPVTWKPCFEIEVSFEGKKFFYYLFYNGEVIIKEYFDWINVEQVFDEEAEEWRVKRVAIPR